MIYVPHRRRVRIEPGEQRPTTCRGGQLQLGAVDHHYVVSRQPMSARCRNPPPPSCDESLAERHQEPVDGLVERDREIAAGVQAVCIWCTAQRRQRVAIVGAGVAGVVKSSVVSAAADQPMPLPRLLGVRLNPDVVPAPREVTSNDRLARLMSPMLVTEDSPCCAAGTERGSANSKSNDGTQFQHVAHFRRTASSTHACDQAPRNRQDPTPATTPPPAAGRERAFR